jgi:hypothetical protein
MKHVTPILVLIVGGFHFATVYADTDCTPLDPRASLSRDKELKVTASADTLYSQGRSLDRNQES